MHAQRCYIDALCGTMSLRSNEFARHLVASTSYLPGRIPSGTLDSQLHIKQHPPCRQRSASGHAPPPPHRGARASPFSSVKHAGMATFLTRRWGLSRARLDGQAAAWHPAPPCGLMSSYTGGGGTPHNMLQCRQSLFADSCGGRMEWLLSILRALPFLLGTAQAAMSNPCGVFSSKPDGA